MHPTSLSWSRLRLPSIIRKDSQSGWWGSHHANDSNHCDWRGINCNDAGSVLGIYGWELNYESKLLRLQTLNFTAFPNLVSLSLDGMGLTGSILKEIGTLTKFSYVVLSNNSLYGKLHPTLSNLTQLEFFHVSFNSLSSIIPSTFGLLKNLIYLKLDSN
ncbi:putative LRR receptor-like serine/threonine-protein kinase [Arachis hypogaea]|nr:putative LRR receptor-like serine/threonine-protein kinase [Arachis hypogaea]